MIGIGEELRTSRLERGLIKINLPPHPMHETRRISQSPPYNLAAEALTLRILRSFGEVISRSLGTQPVNRDMRQNYNDPNSILASSYVERLRECTLCHWSLVSWSQNTIRSEDHDTMNETGRTIVTAFMVAFFRNFF